MQVQRSGGINDTKKACYTLDPAGNRTAATAGSGGSCTGGGAGPSFSVNDVTVTEGGNLVFTVTKSGTATGTTTVALATAPGTATAGSDYNSTPSPNSLSFTINDTSKTVSVATTDDAAVESSETVFLNLSSPTGGAIISDAQGVGTINDNDSTGPCAGVSFSVSSEGPVTEGVNAVFTISKSGTHSGSCTVDYATANGTALSGSDYNAISVTSASFTSAQTSRNIGVTTINDTTVESDETLVLNLSNPGGGATIANSSAIGTINDNDSAGGACSGVTFTINDVTEVEGLPLNFVVTKSGTTSSSCGISYATADGTALAGTHYTTKSGALSFTAAQTSQTVSVTTADLMRQSGNKVMYLDLSNATLGGVIGDSRGKGTIQPSDEPCLTCLQSPAPETPPEEVSAPEGEPQ